MSVGLEGWSSIRCLDAGVGEVVFGAVRRFAAAEPEWRRLAEQVDMSGSQQLPVVVVELGCTRLVLLDFEEPFVVVGSKG